MKAAVKVDDTPKTALELLSVSIRFDKLTLGYPSWDICVVF